MLLETSPRTLLVFIRPGARLLLSRTELEEK